MHTRLIFIFEQMRIITLTTDLGYRDPYLAIVKAKLLSNTEQTQIIDLSCEIKNNNISHAAFVLKNALPYFPDDTIHLVSIKFIADKSNPHKVALFDNSRFLITKLKNQFIVTPDTGLFTLMDPEFNEPVYQVYYEGNTKQHFFLKDVLVDVAINLVQQKQLNEIASETNDFYKAAQFESYVSGNILRGRSIYVDDFGNIITNITRAKFESVVGGRKFLITLPGARLDKICTTYEEAKYGTPLVVFNSFDYLEVAVNGKSAFNMLCPRDVGISLDFNLMIEFYD